MNHSWGALVARLIAFIGAAVAAISLTQPFSESSDVSLWDGLGESEYVKTHYAILAASVITLLLIVLSTFAVAEISLLGAAVTAGVLLGYYLLTWLAFDFLGRGWTFGIAGSAISLVGTLGALIPSLVERTGQS